MPVSMEQVQTEVAWAPEGTTAAFELLRTVTPSPAAFRLQKSLGLTYWAYDPALEEFAWFEKTPESATGVDEKSADIKVVLDKYDRADASKLLFAIRESVRDGLSDKYRVTMQVDTPRPTMFSMCCARIEVASRTVVLGLMRNCEKDMRNEMYLLGVRDLLTEFCASSPSCVLLVDNDGTIREMNDRFATVFRLGDDRALAGVDIRFHEKALGKTLVTKLTDALRTRQQLHGRSKFRLNDDSIVDMNFRIFNFHFRDKYGGIAFAAEEVPDEDRTVAAPQFESILTPVVVVDRRTRFITYANAAAKSAFGIESRHMETERVSDWLLTEADAEALETALRSGGRDAGRIVGVRAYSRSYGRYLLRAGPDQAQAGTHAVLAFSPAGRLQALSARLRKAARRFA